MAEILTLVKLNVSVILHEPIPIDRKLLTISCEIRVIGYEHFAARQNHPVTDLEFVDAIMGNSTLSQQNSVHDLEILSQSSVSEPTSEYGNVLHAFIRSVVLDSILCPRPSCEIGDLMRDANELAD